MRSHQRTAFLPAALAATALALSCAGCATSPVPSGIRQGVSAGVTFADVLANPEMHNGRTVLWGGQILELKSERGGTIVEVLQAPTDSEDCPGNPDRSQGRFLAFADRYLDPAVYRPKRSVTVVGVVEGTRNQPPQAGMAEYRYPLIRATYLYLWPVHSTPVPVYPHPRPYWWGPYWAAPGLDPRPAIIIREAPHAPPPPPKTGAPASR